jgi:hypothetical protein
MHHVLDICFAEAGNDHIARVQVFFLKPVDAVLLGPVLVDN